MNGKDIQVELLEVLPDPISLIVHACGGILC